MTAMRISVRLPPTCDAGAASARLESLLTAEPPNGARVTFRAEMAADGWNAPPVSNWLAAAVNAASRDYFGRDAVYMGEGGTIPFMAMLGDKYPESEFLITGVLGPGSNAHGPNEFLDIPTGKKVTCCVSRVLADHYVHSQSG